jgi:hypothetical protein
LKLVINLTGQLEHGTLLLTLGVFMMCFAILASGTTALWSAIGWHPPSLAIFCGVMVISSVLFIGGGLLIFLVVEKLERTE